MGKGCGCGLTVSVVMAVTSCMYLCFEMACPALANAVPVLIQRAFPLCYIAAPQVDALVNICDAIYISRESEDLESEEALYQLLIQLYRSPEALIVWSKARRHAE